tara:strand:- start:254 stop:631 length:378 start_codon:yes stop_codon:yes gene_type:complete
MNRRQFLTLTISSAVAIIACRWIYLFSALNSNNIVKNLYIFDEKIVQKNNVISFNINKITLNFNKRALDNIKKFLPQNNKEINLSELKEYSELKACIYNDLEKSENLSAGFYLSRPEIMILKSVK